MLTLAEVKTWLRLEQDESHEDDLLQSLMGAAEEYIANATAQDIGENNPIARLLALVLVADWYDHRDTVGEVREEMRPAVRNMVAQLQYAYPDPPDEEEV